jgi:hypothetical protein
MPILKSVWDFFQYQILCMKWLNELIKSALSAAGPDTGNCWAGSARFYLCDASKITLLCAS